VPSAPAGDQVLLLPLGKLDGPVLHSRLSGFPVLRLLFPSIGRHVCSGHLFHSSLHGLNPEQVLTILTGSALAVAPMDHTTPPKEDKVDTLSAEVPMAQALVAQPESKAQDDNLGDADPDLQNFVAVGSKIARRMNSLLQMCWPDSGKSDCPV
jgi:hypothetical protein